MTALTLEQEFLVLRDLTARTGTVLPVQENQLTFWAAVLAPLRSRPTAKAHPDLKVVRVAYTSRQKALPALEKAFRSSVAWLLGPDWTVEVRRNLPGKSRGKRAGTRRAGK